MNFTHIYTENTANKIYYLIHYAVKTTYTELPEYLFIYNHLCTASYNELGCLYLS